ncbi:hypothetical protein Tco_1346533 [Tanacetum coccineum]
MGTHAANGSICSSDLMGAGAGTFLSAVLSAQGYQQRQADMTYILMLDENINMLRLIMVRLSLRWSRISDEHRQVNKSPMQPMGTHAANGSICSSDLIGARAGTFLLAILSAQGYQQRQADMTYILMLDENIDMLRLILVRLSPCWSRIFDEHKQVNKSRMGVNEVAVCVEKEIDKPLSLSFTFIFTYEIFKSLSFNLDRLCHLVISCLDKHAHTLHHLKSLIIISPDNHCLDNIDILKEDLEYQSLRKSLSLILELS